MKSNLKSEQQLVAISTINSTIGIDLGDRWSRYCIVDQTGAIAKEDRVRSTVAALEECFGPIPSTRIIIEAGTHSPWVSRLLEKLGHQVIVANARKVRLIYESDRKNDRVDARMLAKLGRVDVSLLAPIQHRSAEAQTDLMVVRGRDALVAARTQLINAVRGVVKSTGERLPASTTAAFAAKVTPLIPAPLKSALAPLLESIQHLSEQIHRCEQRVEELAEKKYPETKLLRQVKGVGPLISLAYVLTLEDPARFRKSRMVGSYLGLQPKQSESGASAPQLGISKAGNGYLRRLLVQGSQYILGPLAPDSRLRRWGLELAKRGGKNSKKRAVIAVARKLAVLLHKLWVTGEVYEPLYGTEPLPTV
ncbi:MAG TPA: IS110 family transposase [Candidatus Angelobacter sp.]|jgi:transposase|nr:IS110 family transposase [Candidatus Angelobacter sp.]